MEDIQLAWRSIGAGEAGRLLVGLQVFTSSCSCLRISVILGRVGRVDSCSSSHVLVNNTHNGSENPTVGRSGRFPLKTSRMTAGSGLVCSKGRRPVTTCRGTIRLYDRESRSGELVHTSRIVIPRAYISVLFDGSFFRDFLVYPYASGSRTSGAIHRIVPPAL